MPNIDTLSIQFNANGTDKAIKNIKAMGYAVRNLAQSVKSIDASKLSAFTSSMETLKKSVPTEAQTNRMVAFGEAVKSLSSVIGSANIGGFSKDMATLGDAVNTFTKSSVNSIINAVSAMQTLQTQTQATANVISNVIPKKSQPISMGDNKSNLNQATELIASLDKVQVKVNGIQGVFQKIGLVVPTKKFKDLENSAEKVRQKYEELRSTLQKGLNEGSVESDGTEYKKKMAELDALREKYNELILKQRELAQAGGRFTINPAVANAVEKVKTSFNGLQSLLNGVNSGLKSVTSVADRFIGKLRNMGKSAKTATKESRSLADVAKKLSNEFFRVSKMLKLMVTRMALRKVIAEVGNGFKSLAIHSDEFNDSVSGMMNASKQLGYAFSAAVSPIIEHFAPAIIYIINLLIKLTNVIQQVFAALSGKNSYYKAKEFTDDYRKSLEEAGETGKKTAKELKKTVLGFDELNQLQDNNKTSSGNVKDVKDMFDTVEIENKWKNLANYIKKLAKKIFEPLKKAWKRVGDFVIKAWKYAMNEVLKLGKSIARDFWKVWQDEKTVKVFENILKIIGYIGIAVGNLAKRFREAWDKNNVGLKILTAIRDIVLIITEYILKMAIATAKWADTLDFYPILSKISDWLESLKPVVDALMGIVSDFYETVILPLGKWAIEEGGPALLKVFIDFNEAVRWNDLRDHLKELWGYLEKFGQTVGEGLIIFIDRVAQGLAEFLNSDTFVNFLHSVEDWMNSVTATDVADAIEKIVKFYIGIKIAGMLLTVFTKIFTVVKAIASGLAAMTKILPAILVLVAAIAGYNLGLDIFEHFNPNDKELAEKYRGIEGFCTAVKDIFVSTGEFLRNYFEALFNWIDAAIYSFVVKIQQNMSMDAILGRNKEEREKAIAEAEEMARQAKDTLKSVVMPEYGVELTNFRKQIEEVHRVLKELGEQGLDTSKFEYALAYLNNSVDSLFTTREGIAEAQQSLKDLEDVIAQACKEAGLNYDEAAGKLKEYAATTSETSKTMSEDYGGMGKRAQEAAEATKEVADKVNEAKSGTKELSTSVSKTSGELDKMKGKSKDLSGSMDETAKAVSDLSTKIKDTKAASAYYNSLKQDIDKDSKGIKTSVGDIDLKGLEKMIAEVTSGGSEDFEELSTNVDTYMGDIQKYLDDLDVSDINTDFDEFSLNTDTAMGDAKKVVDDSTKDIKTDFDEISKSMEKDKWTFQGVADGFRETFKRAREAIKGEWNQIADKLNGEHQVGSESIKINLPKFARGGFVEDGLFLANHHELIGSFGNGKTAVANNAQIVEGIQSGVYNAVVRANAQNGNSGKYIANTIVMDSDVVARTVSKAIEKQNSRYSPAY